MKRLIKFNNETNHHTNAYKTVTNSKYHKLMFTFIGLLTLLRCPRVNVSLYVVYDSHIQGLWQDHAYMTVEFVANSFEVISKSKEIY